VAHCLGLVFAGFDACLLPGDLFISSPGAPESRYHARGLTDGRSEFCWRSSLVVSYLV